MQANYWLNLTKDTKSRRFSKHQKTCVTLLYTELLINLSCASLPQILLVRELTTREQFREVGFWFWSKDCCFRLPNNLWESSAQAVHLEPHTPHTNTTHTEASFCKDCPAVTLTLSLHCLATPWKSCHILFWMDLDKICLRCRAWNCHQKQQIQPFCTQLPPPTFLYASSSWDQAPDWAGNRLDQEIA